ncbi:TPA: DUF1642 domain-containing protein [Enterococcus faecium]|uniref:DUF1642 domain-containing protein n=1 Tax=Enterococcus faecium TaxID=1352 RepID=UPI00391A38B7
MNKQKLIDKYTAEISRLRPYCPNRHLISEQLKYDLYKEILEDLKQLDEPQKPVVPKCFDIDYKKYKYMENNKSEILFTAIGGIYRVSFYGSFRDLSPNVWKTGIKWNKWTKETILWASRNYADFCQAVISGDYEVEKEPLYCVIINGRYLVKVFSNTNVVILVPADEISQYVTQKFQLTEKQIKAIDERYWPFAVPVDEVVEE